jgi:small-conductance mechanosensitive channel
MIARILVLLLVAMAGIGAPGAPGSPNAIAEPAPAAARTAQPAAAAPPAPAQPAPAQPAAAPPVPAPPQSGAVAPAPPAAAPPAAAQPAADSAAQAPPPPPAPAVELPPEVAKSVTQLVEKMEGAEKSLGKMKDLSDDIGRLRDDVEHVISKSTEVADGLRPRLTEVKSQIDKLGPPPGKDAPPEAPGVAAERARLNGEVAALSGAIKTLELTWVRARQTIDKITDLRLAIFTRSLMERMASPLLPGLWHDVVRDVPQLANLTSYIWNDWIGTLKRKSGVVLALITATLLGYVLLRHLTRRWTQLSPRANGTQPTFFERAAAAAWIAPVRAAPAAAAAFAVYAGLDALDVLYYPSAMIAAAILRAILIFVAVAALIEAVLSPREHLRRLVDLSDRSAGRICAYLQAMTALYAADLALSSIGRTLYFPLSMSVVQSLIASIGFAALLIGLLLTPFEPAGLARKPVTRDRPRWVKLPLWIAAIAIVGSALVGYVALARFASQQLLMTGVVGLVLTLLFLAIRAFTQPGEAPNPVGQLLQSRFGIDEPRRQQLALLTEAALTLSLGIVALPVLLLQWGFTQAEIRDWLKSALFGFEIGHFRISLARILIGIVLFTALLFLTRLVQRTLRETVLSPTRMDTGIANSIDTGVGYAGTALAGLIAVSYAGLDITNLAIVAGALSVGIGFGLQSIVNNFVSGLILLVERPIKVGDLIVVKGQEGYVKRISVRSTEIETPEKASHIVPNSELITGAVTNWTHRDALGRVIVKVRATYRSDADAVLETLRNVGAQCPLVLKSPAPVATLDNLAENALEFSLRAYVGDVNSASEAQSSLRADILRAFRNAGIEIPYAALDNSMSKRPPATNVLVKVRGSYKADPLRTASLMEAVAAAEPRLSAEPKPVVSFEELGENGPEFALVAKTHIEANAREVESALRMALAQAFRREGIEIALPQRDVNLRDLDGVRSLIARVAEERLNPRKVVPAEPKPQPAGDGPAAKDS